MATGLASFPDYTVTILDLIAEGDQVVVEWAYRGRHVRPYDGVASTGKAISGMALSIYRIVAGRSVDGRGVWHQGEVWQQLGLIPYRKRQEEMLALARLEGWL